MQKTMKADTEGDLVCPFLEEPLDADSVGGTWLWGGGVKPGS